MVRSRAVRALPEGEPWSRRDIEAIQVTPMEPHMSGADVEAQEPVAPQEGIPRGYAPFSEAKHQPHGAHVRKDDFGEVLVLLRDAESLSASTRKIPFSVAHSDLCRQRTMKDLLNDPASKKRVIDADNRKTEYKRHKQTSGNMQVGGSSASGEPREI